MGSRIIASGYKVSVSLIRVAIDESGCELEEEALTTTETPTIPLDVARTIFKKVANTVPNLPVPAKPGEWTDGVCPVCQHRVGERWCHNCLRKFVE